MKRLDEIVIIKAEEIQLFPASIYTVEVLENLENKIKLSTQISIKSLTTKNASARKYYKPISRCQSL